MAVPRRPGLAMPIGTARRRYGNDAGQADDNPAPATTALTQRPIKYSIKYYYSKNFQSLE
ncbi:hypothetical protein [Devosia sp. Root436]|uniref:hypothetical protein n=1 Tax=Devosia sp. Root436 TaxID=1736537 RepID=UPI0012E3CABC|nr:hypothetical protein [Devosia sp. Root436]